MLQWKQITEFMEVTNANDNDDISKRGYQIFGWQMAGWHFGQLHDISADVWVTDCNNSSPNHLSSKSCHPNVQIHSKHKILQYSFLLSRLSTHFK